MNETAELVVQQHILYAHQQGGNVSAAIFDQAHVQQTPLPLGEYRLDMLQLFLCVCCDVHMGGCGHIAGLLVAVLHQIIEVQMHDQADFSPAACRLGNLMVSAFPDDRKNQLHLIQEILLMGSAQQIFPQQAHIIGGMIAEVII